jgi:hypothetical protein
VHTSDTDPVSEAAQLIGVHTGAEGYCRTSDPLISQTITYLNENGFRYMRYNEAVTGDALCRHLKSVSDFQCDA